MYGKNNQTLKNTQLFTKLKFAFRIHYGSHIIVKVNNKCLYRVEMLELFSFQSMIS